ncbi:MAG: DoxX family protein [Verrucomicrobia bacterium]|nr:DoxX family protein [Verrucomicrobiota bacterium]
MAPGTRNRSIRGGRKMNKLVFLVRLVVSGLFIVAAFLKLRDYDLTLIAIYQYDLMSWENAGRLAAALPWLEMAGGVGLWIPRLRLGGATLCAGLSAMFIAALASAVIRGLDVNCGCFGTADLHVTALKRLGEDLVLLLLCLGLWVFEARRLQAQLQFKNGDV